jgi:hypothetical protein
MGIKCSIQKEVDGNCTAWNGILEDGQNAWKKIDSVIDEIPCESCRLDGKKVISAAHDVVNITIGETTKAFDPKNLMRFQKRVNAAVAACSNCHVKEPE